MSKDSIKKPVIIYCQGSQPIPLIIENDSTIYINNLDSLYEEFYEDYNIVMISHPHTPLIVAENLLYNRKIYVPDILEPNKFDEKYLKDYYKTKFVDRGSTVINFLRKQAWVDKEKISVIGISQGAQIAVSLVKKNRIFMQWDI
ncbi:hypothetical protein CLV62_101269 [Dysgonomonas alginatilytica]|uniref:Uncharacterized protein n=1 Tax=Dysgonomonas alginatilytica TaxID=1605892 RepID=A0A2V3PV59_9BACT|nr:hypothetical protein [Dysgonomonas alginatilytica]PXV69002.1 hypothetical protein CLV62_101269 [Dysgonomonas alginatilytica]